MQYVTKKKETKIEDTGEGKKKRSFCRAYRGGNNKKNVQIRNKSDLIGSLFALFREQERHDDAYWRAKVRLKKHIIKREGEKENYKTTTFLSFFFNYDSVVVPCGSQSATTTSRPFSA